MIAVLILVGGLILLYFGAEALVKGSSALALRFGLTPLVVGLTVVAYGTSMPELVVSAAGALRGNGDIALGNVVGSNIMNIGVILGLAAVIRPLRIQFQLIRVDVPIAIGTGLLAWFFLLDGRLDRWEAGILTLGIIIYTVASIVIAKKSATPEVREEFDEEVHPSQSVWWQDLLFIVGGIALLVFGARWFVEGAVDLARSFGLSEATIGLTVVAFGTSTPELASSVVAAIRGRADIAVGNVIGSNIYNTLAILGITGLIVPLQAQGVGVVDWGVMLGMTLLLLPLMRTGFVIQRWEGGLLLLCYGGYLFWLWPK